MTPIDWELVFYLGFLCLGIVVLLCQITLRFTLDRRVRKELPANQTYDGFYDAYFGIWRACLFANASVLPGKRFKRTMGVFYNGFDVKKFANRFEKTIAWIHISAGVIFLLCVAFYFLTMWFGIIQWSDA
ncbi:MAG: hypothetical protein ACRBBR_16085 [Cellvibrionaceae bacterium]